MFMITIYDLSRFCIGTFYLCMFVQAYVFVLPREVTLFLYTREYEFGPVQLQGPGRSSPCKNTDKAEQTRIS